MYIYEEARNCNLRVQLQHGLAQRTKHFFSTRLLSKSWWMPYRMRENARMAYALAEISFYSM